VPRFEMQTDWDVESALGFISTWSAVQRYRKRFGRDPVALLAPLLTGAWGAGRRILNWPLSIRAGHR